MSSNNRLTITPRDPIIARDGRPFGSNERVRSLDWIYPSVVAGALRTMLGKRLDMDFSPGDVARLKQITLRGPLPFLDGNIFVPKPLDCLVEESGTEKEKKAYAVRPAEPKDGEGTDLPHGLRPVMLPETKKGEFKPERTNAFWSLDKMVEWLVTPTFDGGTFNETETLAAPDREERTHVAIEPMYGSAKDSMLFSTTGLDLTTWDRSDSVRLIAEVESPDVFAESLNGLNALHPLGGERRLVHWKTESSNGFDLPGRLKGAETRLARMVLATPAIFRNGWIPGWIDGSSLRGTVPGTEVKVRLIGAIVDRWRPISGWSYEKGSEGPKPARRLVPAGSVFFLEIESGHFGQILETAWLRSVCDDEQDRRDGFGLALWGTWVHNE